MYIDDTFTQKPTLQFVKTLTDLDVYPFFRSIADSEATRVHVNGKEMVMIGSNNYLGLTHHPHVKERAIKAIEKYGTGCTGSRFLNGNLELHEELEQRLANFVGKDQALVFATGMQVNLGVIPSIVGPRDCMYNDMENHASIIDGSRISMGDNFKYRHNDMDNLEELLINNQGRYKNQMIISDAVFSMTGDIAHVPEIAKLSKKYGALVYMDDAHGIGVIGRQGRGTVDHFGVTDDIDLIMGTFSKAFGSIGGFIAGNNELISWIKHTARSFIFSAAMAPSSVATVLGCLDVMETDGSLHERLWQNVHYMQKGFEQLNLYTYNSKTPIIPVLIGEDMKAFQATKFLYENGVFATPVVSPAVPKGEALIRTSFMPTHSKEDLDFVLDVFSHLVKKFDLPKAH